MDTMSINLVDENNLLRQNVADLQKQLQQAYMKINHLSQKKAELEQQLQSLQQ